MRALGWLGGVKACGQGVWVYGEDMGVGPRGLAETPPIWCFPLHSKDTPRPLMTDSQMHLTY